ncbi:hypothetical protein A1O7_01106 [Cladophialophora yegresii CBS 114405]|uniref:Uncharacterized protein n=1 Tax=Cladophialophora yegresii CBS 114405 TaxID=1182544 RepID=W9W9Y1_9EURO|nr:uncharacterized protein A1O7_01106 [Cladophialophora yegresii CBS 114405]EXJ64768.1 hypothetical protein A1O7_01106 [Cladophialophora yegresii CBS 114405]
MCSAEYPAAQPVNHGRCYEVEAKIHMEVVEETLSPQFLEFVPILCGPKGLFNMMPFEHGKAMTIGIFEKAQTDEEIV